MQSVCKSWSSILKNTSRELPLLMMLPNNKEEDPDARDFFSLSKQRIHTVHLPEMRGKRCCGSFQNGWLMIEDDKLDIFLFHPGSKKKINLPHSSTLEIQIYKNPLYSNEDIRDMEIIKADISDDGKVVVIVYGVGFVAYCRIGDEAYTHVDDTTGMGWMEDVRYHKGKFYLVDGLACVYLLHIEDDSCPYIERLTVKLRDDFDIPYTIYGYLVLDILTDSIFVITRNADRYIGEEDDTKEEEEEEVVGEEEGEGGGGEGDDTHDDRNTEEQEERLPHKTTHFDIFRVTLEDSKTLKRFTKVESLGDRVVFLGHNSSIVVLASQFPGFKGNRIYFADNLMEKYHYHTHGCRDSGVFSLEDGTVEELFADRFHPTMAPPLWIATPPYSYRMMDTCNLIEIDELSPFSITPARSVTRILYSDKDVIARRSDMKYLAATKTKNEESCTIVAFNIVFYPIHSNCVP
ncbi:f-box protein skip23 [Cinnamomum micranthum f. kanehirae]|uniref:F-box protein skip23 n=1 Tax=Cinnamomum micranthum f. kanehirae TaxID=337451 RepID=A0A3S3MJC5_9MAGN|nr:f-box protein skip23 [Cinnamomum micranthum f. kanehirae]